MVERPSRKVFGKAGWTVGSWFPVAITLMADCYSYTRGRDRSTEASVHCKNIRISTDTILWRMFHILTEPAPYTFVSVNRRRNNETRAHIAMWIFFYSVGLQKREFVFWFLFFSNNKSSFYITLQKESVRIWTWLYWTIAVCRYASLSLSLHQ